MPQPTVILELGTVIWPLTLRPGKNYKPNLLGLNSSIPKENGKVERELDGYKTYNYWFPLGNFMEKSTVAIQRAFGLFPVLSFSSS